MQKQYLWKLQNGGDFTGTYSCYFKRLSCVIFMKETVTARRKYVWYCTNRVSRPRQGQYGIHNVNPQSGWPSDDTLLKQKGPLAPQEGTTSLWMTVESTIQSSEVVFVQVELLFYLRSPSVCFRMFLCRCCVSFRWFNPFITEHDWAELLEMLSWCEWLCEKKTIEHVH